MFYSNFSYHDSLENAVSAHLEWLKFEKYSDIFSGNIKHDFLKFFVTFLKVNSKYLTEESRIKLPFYVPDLRRQTFVAKIFTDDLRSH